MAEPELGPRQAALVDALTTRLWSGLPLNEHDLTAVALLADVLGLPPFPSGLGASAGSDPA